MTPDKAMINFNSLHVCRMSSSITAHGKVTTTFVGSVVSGLVTERKQCLLFA